MWIDRYEFSKPQWEFNVRYGAPPISNKMKKRLEIEFPNTQKEINACHKRLIGRAITAEEITRSIDEDNQNNPMWAITRSLMKMGGGPRVPQKRSELNAASDFEQMVAMKTAQLEQMLHMKSDKNWCSKYNEMPAR